MRTNRARSDAPRLDLAPMLDVTFLLLVFFLCTIQFKNLEGRLDSFLPKDVGVDVRPKPDVLEPVDIRIVDRDGASMVYVARKPITRITDRDPAHELRLPELASVIRSYRESLADSRYRIDPDPDVPHGHVVAVLDTLVGEGIGQIAFTMPGERRR